MSGVWKHHFTTLQKKCSSFGSLDETSLIHNCWTYQYWWRWFEPSIVFCVLWATQSCCHTRKQAKILYLLKPADPMDFELLRAMTLQLKTLQALNDTWTVITGNQATWALAMAISERNKGDINVFLFLGGFYQAHNYLKAICKIQSESGMRELLCQEECVVKEQQRAFLERKLSITSLHMPLDWGDVASPLEGFWKLISRRRHQIKRQRSHWRSHKDSAWRYQRCRCLTLSCL